jgi:hypothetical protein
MGNWKQLPVTNYSLLITDWVEPREPLAPVLGTRGFFVGRCNHEKAEAFRYFVLLQGLRRMGWRNRHYHAPGVRRALISCL